jgi:hypothetical protein
MVEPGARILLPFRPITHLLRPRQDLTEGLHLVRDEDEWTRHWAGSSSRRLFEPPVPPVDWPTEMCVVVALGTRSNGGFGVLIGTMHVFEDRLTVVAWEIRPGHNCATTRGVTHPFQAVAAPAHSGPAQLIKNVAYQDCEATGY